MSSDAAWLEERPALGDLAARWDALNATGRPPTPFATSWWVDSTGGDRRTVLLVWNGGELVGGLALARCRRRGLTRLEMLEMLGTDVAAPDHIDVLARPGHEDVVVAELGRWFDDLGSFVLRAEAVAADGLLGRVLPGARIVPFSTAPYLVLDPEVSPEPHAGRVRSTVRRSSKRLQREGLEHRVHDTTGPAFEAAVDTLDRLHRLRWPDGSNFSRDLPGLRPALRAGVAAGGVGVHELVVGERVVASMLVFDLADRRCYYQSGREMGREVRGCGTVLMQLVIDHAHERGLREFDFLRGDESYKLDWTTTQRPLHRAFAGAGPTGRAAAAGLAAFERSKPALRVLRDGVRNAVAQADPRRRLASLRARRRSETSEGTGSRRRRTDG